MGDGGRGAHEAVGEGEKGNGPVDSGWVERVIGGHGVRCAGDVMVEGLKYAGRM